MGRGPLAESPRTRRLPAQPGSAARSEKRQGGYRSNLSRPHQSWLFNPAWSRAHRSFVRTLSTRFSSPPYSSLLCFSAGYPLITYFTRHPLSTIGGFNIGGINATGQVAHYSLALPLQGTHSPHHRFPAFREIGVLSTSILPRAPIQQPPLETAQNYNWCLAMSLIRRGAPSILVMTPSGRPLICIIGR